MVSADNINIDNSPDVIPLQAGQGIPQQPIVARTVGTISSIAGLPGPDILIATGAATKGLSIVAAPVGSTITFSISGVTTAIKESSGPTTLDIGAVADGQFLKRVGATVVGAAPTAAGETLLSSTVVDLNSTSSQDLYQVVSGTLIITRTVARAPSVDISGYLNSVALLESTSGESVIDDFTAAQWAFLADANHFYPGPGHVGANAPYHVVAASGKVRAKPSIAFGSAATVIIDLFGYFV